MYNRIIKFDMKSDQSGKKKEIISNIQEYSAFPDLAR